MNLPGSVRVRFEDLRSLGWASFGAAYVGVGASFTNPIRLIKITNTSDANLLISFDGISDHDMIPANGFCIYDYGSNATGRSGYLEQPAGDRLYVKLEGAAATSGNIYVTLMYVSQV